MKILLVDDDESLRELTTFILSNEHHEVVAAESGEQALEIIHEFKPDLILLDIVLPGKNGYEICEKLKEDQSTSCIPIIMLSQLGSEDEVSEGLSTYADDYITKPFKPKILLARIASVTRRVKIHQNSSKILLGPIEIDYDMKEVYVKNRFVKLRAAEFEILHFLAQSPNKALSREEIISGIKGGEYAISQRAVDNYIYCIRKALGDSGKMIETAPGFGYRIRIR